MLQLSFYLVFFIISFVYFKSKLTSRGSTSRRVPEVSLMGEPGEAACKLIKKWKLSFFQPPLVQVGVRGCGVKVALWNFHILIQVRLDGQQANVNCFQVSFGCSQKDTIKRIPIQTWTNLLINSQLNATEYLLPPSAQWPLSTQVTRPVPY